MNKKAFLEWELILYLSIMLILCLVGIFSFTNYATAKFDIQKEQINNLDVALERYSTDHLMIKDVYMDNENNIVDKKQKTYPEKLDELIDLGYINHIENIDDFEYKPYKKDNYYIYYELKIKKPLSNSYYISEGSKRSEYIAKKD